MEAKLSTIDPIQNNIPDNAVIQKVISEKEKLPNEKHDKAVKAFLIADAIASGIGNDLAFVDKIPQFIDEIIENKSWECLFVSKGVAHPYYCRYDKGTDSENFQAFIVAKRPNGLGTSVETLDRVLQAESEIQRKFRAIIYESRQGERTDLEEKTSPTHWGKLKHSQKEYLRAANRAAEAIPIIGELLDRGLIAISIAAKLGRQIKDPDHLTAEEREYIDKRDLVGLRINKYINTNTIPEDEDREPAYSRELNRFVKDLLGIKNRSKAVRMDNPRKAAEKLLKFYDGEKLRELVECLNRGLQQDSSQPSPENTKTPVSSSKNNDMWLKPLSNDKVVSKHIESFDEHELDKFDDLDDKKDKQKAVSTSDSSLKSIFDKRLTQDELAERLGVKSGTIFGVLYKEKEKFTQWTQKKDPEDIGWTRTEKKRGRKFLFAPVQNTEKEERD